MPAGRKGKVSHPADLRVFELRHKTGMTQVRTRGLRKTTLKQPLLLSLAYNDRYMKIAFDVDDCLLIPSVASGFGRDTPNYETIANYKWLQSQGHTMIIWSGSGIDWAKTWAEKCGLTPDDFPPKGAYRVDIAFDDCDVDLGTVNVRVKRMNNSISRSAWNATKQG
jgi:hypothetical protein